MSLANRSLKDRRTLYDHGEIDHFKATMVISAESTVILAWHEPNYDDIPT